MAVVVPDARASRIIFIMRGDASPPEQKPQRESSAAIRSKNRF
jgi:hypothetical protein